MELRFQGDFSRVPARAAYAKRAMTHPGDAAESEAERIVERRPRAGARADFSAVRVHTDGAAAESAGALGAEAYTLGSDIVFAQGRYAPRAESGRELLAHELAHVVQQPSALVARAVSSQYGRMKSNLTYGLFDWAITDAEAHEVLLLLNGLGAVDFADTLHQLEREGLVDRLLENISDPDRVAFAALIQKLHQSRGGAQTARFIENLMSYGLLDWAITDAEAHMALEALKSLEPTPARLKDVVARIPRRQYERFYDNLSTTDRRDNLRFLQNVEMIRSSGMTFGEMSEEQRKHLQAHATAAGKTIGAYIGGETAARGYGGSPVTWWPSLLPAAKAAWVARFHAVVAAVKAAAPDDIREVIRAAEAAGGGIKFEPERTEELNAYGFTDGASLGVGKDWIEAAEADPRYVFENIAHEIGGHRRFGREASWDVMRGTLALLPPAERALATGGSKSPYTAYGYMETEMYAELREVPYRIPGRGSDEPSADVPAQMRKIKDAFEPRVAEAIVRGFRRRIQLDEGISAEARALYDRAAKLVFGIEF
jgi:hypothetical protein